MRGKRPVSIVVGCVLAALIGGACSSGSSSSNGDKTAFCKTNADISSKLAGATSEAQAIDAFKSVQSQFDSFVKNAPSEVKADAQTLVDAARKAIADNNASQFQSDQKLSAAGNHVDTFCGQKSSSSSTSSSSSSSTSESALSTGSATSKKACDLFDLDSLNSATSLTWKVVDNSQDNSCTVQADNGNTVAMVVTPTGGQTSAVLDAGKSACDSGTSTDTSVGDGGFVCKVSGINTTGALFGGSQKFVVISAVTFNGASDDDVQTAIVALLKSFQAS